MEFRFRFQNQMQATTWKRISKENNTEIKWDHLGFGSCFFFARFNLPRGWATRRTCVMWFSAFGSQFERPLKGNWMLVQAITQWHFRNARAKLIYLLKTRNDFNSSVAAVARCCFILFTYVFTPSPCARAALVLLGPFGVCDCVCSRGVIFLSGSINKPYFVIK